MNLRFTLLFLLLLSGSFFANAQIAPNWTPVERAVATGDTTTLKRLFRQGGDLRANDGNLLVLSIEYEQAKILAFLTEQGVVLNKTHPRYTKVWESYIDQLIPLAEAFYRKGQYRPAVLAHEQLQEVYGEQVSKQDKIYAILINNLAELYRSISQHKKALSLFLEAKAIREQVLGKRHPDYAQSLHNLAELYREIGQYEKALPLFLEAKAIFAQSQGKSHPNYAITIGNLAKLYMSINQYEKALPLFLETKNIFTQVQGKDHPNYAILLNDLAALYKSMGQYDKALSLYLESKVILGQVLGKSHPEYALSLNNLADLYQSMGQYENALHLYLETKVIWEQVLGKSHPKYATSLNNLGESYRIMGQYKKALPLILESKAILEQVLGKNHPDYATSLSNLALLYQSTGQYEQVWPLIREARQQYRSQLLSQIGVLNEAAIRQFQDKFDYSAFDYSLGYFTHTQALAAQHYADALLGNGIGLLATQHLNTVINQTQDTTAQRLTSQLRLTRLQLNRQLDLPLSQQKNVESLQKQAIELEQQLIRQLPEYGQAFNAIRVEWQQVQQALQPNEATIEFVAFRYYNRQLRTVVGKQIWQLGYTDSTCYMALLLRPGWKQPKVVRLGEQRQLDTLLMANPGHAQINNLYRGGVVSSTPGQNQQTQGLVLSRFIWQPLDSLLKGVKTVYVAPAGRLHQIALAALPNPADTSQRMADRFAIRQVGSTRVVALRHQKPNQPLRLNERPTILYGGIQYEADSMQLRRQARADEVEHRLAYREATRSGEWSYLPGTQVEVGQIQRLLPPTHTRTFTSLAASEQSLKALSGRPPAVLHVATHGFFFSDLKQSKTEQGLRSMGEQNRFEVSEDPLLRSGLIMAGANYVWKGGKPLEGVDDGILTASEVAALNLTGTELVVLSACETGLGTVRGSEGVFGLQRAFKQAGVRYVLMSLWKVSDAETAEYMKLFYEELLRSGSVEGSYRSAQRQMRSRYPQEPFKWAAFVLVE